MIENMFQTNQELKKVVGKSSIKKTTTTLSRDTVVTSIQQSRQERTFHRQIEDAKHKIIWFIYGRLCSYHFHEMIKKDWDKKVHDIHMVQLILRQTNPEAFEAFQIPLELLYQLIRELVFFYKLNKEDDVKRLEELSCLVCFHVGKHIHDKLIQKCVSTLLVHQSVNELKWQFILLSMSFGYDADNHKHSLYSFENLYKEMKEYLLIPSSTSLILQCRNAWIQSMNHLNEKKDKRLIEILIFLTLSQTSSLQSQFVSHILSIPLITNDQEDHLMLWEPLLESSTWRFLLQSFLELKDPIPSCSKQDISNGSVWLLGNLISLSTRMKIKTDTLLVLEYKVWIYLIQFIPLESYSSNAIIMQNISNTYISPVVFPKQLLQQLYLLIDEQKIRETIAQLFQYHLNAMKKPLKKEKPQPKYPSALTDHEKYGFGNLAAPSSKTVFFSWSKIWKQSKWAKKIFNFSSSSLNSFTENQKEEENKIDNTLLLDNEKNINQRIMISPFYKEGILIICHFFSIFFYQWPIQHNSSSLSVLSTLSFYSFPSSSISSSSNSRKISMVEMLWSFLQETVDMETYIETISLQPPYDPLLYVIVLFMMIYQHILFVLDDTEMYEEEYPLYFHEVERIILIFKSFLYRMIWLDSKSFQYENEDEQDKKKKKKSFTSIPFDQFILRCITQLLRSLYNRCSRRPFCNASSWIMKDVQNDVLIKEILSKSNRSLKLIESMPYVIPFVERVHLFEQLINLEKIKHQPQNEQSRGYRIDIRRKYLLEDGLSRLNVMRKDLRKRIIVVFINEGGLIEHGIDSGGLFKEFWNDLSCLAFDPNFGLFQRTQTNEMECIFPNPAALIFHGKRLSIDLFEFLGRILGKAIYERILIQPNFAHFFLSQLLGKINSFNDLPSLDFELYKNLMFLKEYDGDVQELCLFFSITCNNGGQQKEIDLIPNGSKVAVTNHNRIRYIHLVANYHLNVSIHEQSVSFLKGLLDLIDLKWLQMFNEPELQVIISGTPGAIDIEDLKKNTRYIGGYFSYDKYITRFWRILKEFNAHQLAQLLRFTTSCSRAPTLGFSALNPPFCIQRVNISKDNEKLPTASTCFNTLKLPNYSSEKVMKEKLITSITSGAGFELS